MKNKIVSLLVLVCMILCIIPSNAAFADENTYCIYVAPDGSDSADGSFENPVLSLDRAREMARNADKSAYDKIVVYFRGGDYTVTEKTTFTAEDSGTETCPVIYTAYAGETVRFIGAKKIRSSDITSAAESEVASLLIDRFAASKLMKMDISGYDVTFPERIAYGFGVSDNWWPVEFYINGSALKSARWPNDESNKGFLYISEANNVKNDAGKITSFTLSYTDETNRIQSWSDRTCSSAWIYGPIANGYAQAAYPVTVNKGENSVTCSRSPGVYTPSANQKFYFTDVPEEIDVPGEYWLDTNENIVYFYPPCDMKDAEVFVADFSDNMILLSGVSNITFKNLDFMYTVRTPIYADSSLQNTNITVDGCDIMHTSDAAVWIPNATDTTVKNCHIYDTGRYGIMLGGGDRETLTPNNNLIENNRIHRTDRVFASREAGIFMQGVGGAARHNEVYDYKREAVYFGTIGQYTNDIIFEYNYIHDAVREGSDFGALYMGRSPSRMGMRITNNYFNNIGNTYGGIGQQAIFIDDGDAGAYIYGNVFANIQGDNAAIKYNGAQFSVVENNVFVNMAKAFIPGDWTFSAANGKQDMWWLYVFSKEESKSSIQIWNKDLSRIPYTGDTWKNHYANFTWTDSESGKVYSTDQWKFLNEYFTEEHYEYVKDLDMTADKAALRAYALEHAPATGTNIHRGNVLVNVGVINDANRRNSTVTDAYSADASIFEDYNGENYAITQEGLAEINEGMEYEFEPVRLSSMGLLTDVGGNSPTASNVGIFGKLSEGSVAQIDYTYFDADGDREGTSLFNWYISDTADRDFEKILNRHDSSLPIESDYTGKYIKAEVIAYDITGMYGHSVLSAPVLVGGESVYKASVTQNSVSKNGSSISGTIRYSIENSNAYDGDITVVLGIYDENEKMAGIYYCTKNVINGTTNFDFSVSLTADEGKSYKYKIIPWKDLRTMNIYGAFLQGAI